MSTNPTPQTPEHWEAGDLAFTLWDGRHKKIIELNLWRPSQQYGDRWSCSDGHDYTLHELAAYTKLTRENVAAVLFGEEPPPAGRVDVELLRWANDYIENAVTGRADEDTVDMLDRIESFLATQAEGPVRLSALPPVPPWLIDASGVVKYAKDEDDVPLRPDRIILGLGEYADEGEPDCAIDIWSHDSVEAIGTVVSRAIKAWLAGGEVPVPAAPEAPNADELVEVAAYCQRQIAGIQRSSYDNPASQGALQAFEDVERFVDELAGRGAALAAAPEAADDSNCPGCSHPKSAHQLGAQDGGYDGCSSCDCPYLFDDAVWGAAPVPAAPEAPECPECHNQFEGRMPGHVYGSNWDFVPCRTCNGTGAAPVPAAQPDTAAELLRIADTHPCAPCARDLRLLAEALSAPVDPKPADETSAT